MNKKAKSLNKKIEVNILLLTLAIFAIFTFLISKQISLGPTITGLVTVKEQINYTDNVNLEFTESGTYTWNLQNPGDLKSIRLDGSKNKQGSSKVYIEKDNIRYLIFDSNLLEDTSLDKITGLAVGDLNATLNETINETSEKIINETFIEIVVNDTTEINETIIDEIIINGTSVNDTVINASVEINETTNQTTEEKTIDLALEYKTGTNWDTNDDGIESLDGVIDFTVEDSLFNWDINENKLCTRWEIYSEEDLESTLICHGNQECCNFVELQPTLDTWNAPFDLYKGRFYDSKQYVVSAYVNYVDIDLENLQYDIIYSDPANLPAVFEEGLISFEDICIDTCSVSKFDQDSYQIIVVIDNSTLRIDNLKYTIEKKVAKLKENIICEDFEDNVLWSSSYSQLPQGSTKYYTWDIRTNCTEAGGNNCFLQNVSAITRSIYMGHYNENGSYDENIKGEGYVQISDLDESICNNPEQGVYSRYLAYESLKGESRKTEQHCGKNKNPNSRCAFETTNKYDYNPHCYGVKAYGSQNFLLDVFKVSYTWCWDASKNKGGKS